MKYSIDLKNPRKQVVKKLSDKFQGTDLRGNELGFTNYYLSVNGEPFFGILGECHYSRVQENQWEDTILKMKMGGLNTVATYCFWNHHEEVEGTFRFDGNRNIRKFIELCKKHGMYVIVRIGPFDHGEVRNGGISDWLYGKPFEVRSLDKGWLHYTRKLYREFAKQFEGLYFKDGGPIIGTQIENEYMHSGAPWEMTTGITNEWVPGGRDGADYMRTLKKIAQEEGIITPFYTCTGWGGAAAALDEMLPLWGGYAFWPWIFYDYKGEHPATPEYIYRDNHNNQVPKTYNFEPTYEPESFPYACCEMGGGMTCYYNYRFQLPYESVDAMANIKIASGCNFLGYYMYRGGSNPRGEKTPYLNECQCPKISYDYQAPIGEYGQLRPSYFRLKALHLLAKNFRKQLCEMVTVLPEGSQDIEPEDQDTLRYAVRTDGQSGFLFLNNYQDHCECRRKEKEEITVEFADEKTVVRDLSLAAGEEAILPLRLNVSGCLLDYATVQPLSVLCEKNKKVYFFFVPEGMKAKYVWKLKAEKIVWKDDGCEVAEADGICEVAVSEKQMSSYIIKGQECDIQIVTFTRQQSLNFYELEADGRKAAALCDSPLVFDGKTFEIENPTDGRETSDLLVYPSLEFIADGMKKQEVLPIKDGIFEGVQVKWEKECTEASELAVRKCGEYRFVFEIPENYEQYKDARIQILYTGDVGHAFVNGILISDNFCNGAVWEIGLKEAWKPSMGNEVTIYITPKKADAAVDVSSTMAGRVEQLKSAAAELKSVKIQPVGSICFRKK